MSEINQLEKVIIKQNQIKRVNNSKIVTYKDKEEYLVSPGFTTVKVSALKSYYKTIGLGSLL